jgi:tetratricopeptide (TPR) repeat protein
MTNKLDKARTDIDESISTDPYNAWAYRNKGIYYLMLHQYDDALRVLKQAESMDPFIDKVYIYLAEAYLQTKDFENACKAYEKSIERGERGSTSMKPCK